MRGTKFALDSKRLAVCLCQALRKIFLDENLSRFSVALISSAMFFTASTIFAIYVFVQFSALEVLSVALSFLVIFLLLLVLFAPGLLRQRISLSKRTLLWSSFFVVFMFIVLNSTNELHQNHFQTFPLLEAEVGIGWTRDSAYHASIIQSFRVFGYPSIGQHGSPFTAYHVLSHFMDSLVIRATGVNVWDSYGLFYFFKSALLVMSISIFITLASKFSKPLFLLISLIFVMPIIVGTWHAVGSHGLWFTSLLVIMSAPWVFGLLTQVPKLTNGQFALLFLLLTAISLGKISSGFMYGAFAGTILLLKRPRDLRIYLFGFALVLFFVTFYSLFSYTREGFGLPQASDLDRFVASTRLLGQILILLSAVSIIAFTFRSKSALQIALGASASVSVLVGVVLFQPSLTSDDIFFFTYGLSNLLLLFVYQEAISSLTTRKHKALEDFSNSKGIAVRSSFGVTMVLSTVLFYSPLFALSYEGASGGSFIKNAYSQKFSNLNNFDPTLQANILAQFQNRDSIDFEAYPRPMKNFRDGLVTFMEDNELEARDTLLFVPEEIMQKDIAGFGDDWGKGMFIYAVTGVPLIYGIESLRESHGHADYDQSSLQTPREEFESDEACKFRKQIVVVEDFQNAQFSQVNCLPNS